MRSAFMLGLFLVSQYLVLAAPSDHRPTLVVFISVDQMREDYFERFHAEFTGGLGRLYREGVFFSGATLNYAASETGPGHTTLSTGRYPAHSGIVGNEWIDPFTRHQVYCVEDSTAGPVDGEGGYRSPRNLLVRSLGDWLKGASPASKVFSISGKDRAAILMGGKGADGAFWYRAASGHMISSSYYGRELPEWVREFNSNEWVEHNAPQAWEKLFPDDRYASDEPDNFPADAEDSTRVFPHRFTRPQWDIQTSPWWDFLLLDFAADAVTRERLGERGVSDLLCISLSATDYIGHSYGPHSQEMHDHLLRLDRRLGEFFDRLEQQVGRQNIVIALSADHGVLPLPEYLMKTDTVPARRINSNEFKANVAALDSTLRREFGTREPVITQTAFLNYRGAAGQNIDSLMLEKRIRDGFLGIDGVADVYFRRALSSSVVTDDPFLDLFRRSYLTSRGADFELRFCEWCLLSWKKTGTSHGSPYYYDMHVPIVFMSRTRAPRRITRVVHTVDIAPTLGSILGISIPHDIDGVVLDEVLK